MEEVIQMPNDELEISLGKIAEDLNDVRIASRGEDLIKFINEANKFKNSVNNFSNMFEDFLMELETTEREKWEEQQSINEYDYQQSFPKGVCNEFIK